MTETEKLYNLLSAARIVLQGWEATIVFMLAIVLGLSLPAGKSGGDPDVEVTVIVNK